MAYTPRYQMRFNDQKGAAWVVSLCLDNYQGDITALEGGPTPVTIRYDGDESNIFDPIRKSKAILQVYIRETDSQIFSDTESITDKTIYTLIECPSQGFKWEGWLIPDERHKKLQKDGYYFSITAIDVFSQLKGYYFQNEDGSIVQNQIQLLQALYIAMLSALKDTDSWKYKIAHVISYYGADISDANVNGHILYQAGIWGDTFLDSNARSVKSEDVLDRIMKSCGMYAFYSNGYINFRSPLALVQNSIRIRYKDTVPASTYSTLTRDINTKSFSDQGSFLLNNAEDITNEVAQKEVSVKFTYTDIVSIMRNSSFLNYDEGTNTFTDWPKVTLTLNPNGNDYTTTIEKQPDGQPRRGNPRVLRMNGYWDVNAAKTAQAVRGSGFRRIKQGEKVKIGMKFRYQDYRSIAGFPEDISIYLEQRILLVGASSSYIYYNVKGDDRWLAAPAPGNGLGPFEIEIRSTRDFQSYSITTDPAPIEGDLFVFLLPVVLTGVPNPWLGQVQKFVDYQSINIGIDAMGNANEVTGQVHYQTQGQSYSTIAETEDAYFGDTPNDTIAGTLFKGDAVILPMTQPAAEWLCTIDSKVYPFLRQLVRTYMYFSRFPKPKIQCEIFSNELRFEDLLLFRNGTVTYQPGKYMQMTDEYNVKACQHRIVAMALNGAFADQTDEYEYVDETSGGD